MPPSGECLSRIAQAAAMVNDFSGKHNMPKNHNFSWQLWKN
jgi:hypothetical protein